MKKKTTATIPLYASQSVFPVRTSQWRNRVLLPSMTNINHLATALKGKERGTHDTSPSVIVSNVYISRRGREACLFPPLPSLCDLISLLHAEMALKRIALHD